MTTAKELLKQRYYEPIKEQPELFVGIELEYPVVNLSGNATDVSLTKQLLVYLLDNFDFQADKIKRKIVNNIIKYATFLLIFIPPYSYAKIGSN